MKKCYFLGFLLCVGCGETPTEQNFADIQKIQRGMSIREVDSIMRNAPIRIWDNPRANIIILDYENKAFGASDDFSICLSEKDSLVVNIYYGD